MKTVVKAGRVINCDSIIENAFILIENEKIQSVETNYLQSPLDHVIDAAGLDVYPGAIDPHTHLNDPGETISEDFYTGTASAAAGGITTVLDMPVTIPLVDCPDAFIEKKTIASAKAVTDFGLWCAATPDNREKLPELSELGAAAFKAYLSRSRFCKSHNLGELWETMNTVKSLDRVLGLHAEIQDIVNVCEKPYREKNSSRFSDFARGRSDLAEKVAVKAAVELAMDSGVKLHIVHVTVPEAIESVLAAKKQGYSVTAETCPHYLSMTLDDLDRPEIGPLGVCIPPLRSLESLKGLWLKIERDEIDFIGSDHATYTFQEKATTDIWNTYFGITSIQTMIPLIYDGMMKRNLSPMQFASFISSNAARRYSLKSKGYIGRGYDADLLFIDPNDSWTVKEEDLFYKMKWTTYAGQKLKGKIISTMLRGNLIYSEGKILAAPGSGRFVKPQG